MSSYLHIIRLTCMYSLIGIVPRIVPIRKGLILDRATFDALSLTYQEVS